MFAAIVKDYIAMGTIFLFIFLGGLFAYLTLTPLIGFIPYSDTSGWHLGFFEISSEDMYENALFMASWLRMLILYALIIFTVGFAIVRVMEHRKQSQDVIVYTSGILFAFLCGFIVNLVGWYISIHISAVVFSFLCGLLFGLFVLPKQRFILSMIDR